MTNPVHALLGDQYRYDKNSGEYYAKVHQEMAEMIHRTWPNLSLAWIPPSKRNNDPYPFALIETDVLGQQHLVCNCREDELPLLMERIWEMNKDQIDILAQVDEHNAKIKKQRRSEADDAMMEAHDKAYHLIKGKNWYNLDGMKVAK